MKQKYQNIMEEFCARNQKFSFETQKDWARVFSSENMIGLFNDILSTPDWLEEIAKRSYIHSQGFLKIILLDGREGSGYKLRLHIWDMDVISKFGAPFAEDKHEHRWDFVSTLLRGKIENHRYTISKANSEEEKLYQEFEKKALSLPLKERKYVANLLDLVEVKDLDQNSSGIRQYLYHAYGMTGEDARDELKKGFDLTNEEVDSLVTLLVKQSNTREPKTGQEVYKRESLLSFRLKDIEMYKSGDSYFHPIELGHRLFLDPKDPPATLICTSPVREGSTAGECVRIGSVNEGEEDKRERTYLTVEQLSEYLNEMIKTLSL